MSNSGIDQTLISQNVHLLPRLAIRIPGRAEHQEILRAKTILLGRNKGNTVQLQSRIVSGKHARLDRQGQGYTITDLDSTNGTFLNDQRLTPQQAYPLSANDQIRLGKITGQAVTLIYLTPSTAATAASPPVAPVPAQLAIGSVNLAGIEGSELQIGDIKVEVKAGGDIVGRDKIVNNVNNVIRQAATAAREADDAYAYATKRLADGIRNYAQRLAAVAGQTSDAAEVGPYKGLLAYRLSDADLFYGREQAIDTLLKIINRNPLTVLHSESGAGKSSLFQAGISPRLLVREGTHLPVYLRPYNVSPTLAIKRAFLPNITDIPELEAAPLQEFLRQVIDVLGPQASLYLLLDQFEELFTVLKEDDRAAFISELASCVQDDSLQVRWVLALRSEFFSDIANFRPEIENPFENEYRLNRLTREEAAQVIVVPAARQGIGFEPALVENLLVELRDDKGQLAPPQLQLVCSALYNLLLERQRTTPNLPGQITLKMYEEEGRARGILQGHLRRVLSRTLPTRQERDLARQVLVTLISSDQRRRRLTQSHLARELANYIITAQEAGEVLEQLDPLLGRLVKSRLLNIERDEETDEITYELAHDYLLTEIEIDPDLQARKAAQEMLDREVESFKRFSTLLSEDKFRIINSQRAFLNVDDAAQELLQVSQEAIEAEEQEKEAQRQRELEQQRALAEEQRRRAEEQTRTTKRLRRWALGLAVVFVLAVVATVFAVSGQREAQHQSQVAEQNAEQALRQTELATSRQLAAQANSLTDSQLDLALLLSLEANRTGDTIEARNSVLTTLNHSPRLKTYLHQDSAGALAFSPDGQLLATGEDETIVLWDTTTGQRRGEPLIGHTASVIDLRFSPDGQTLVSVSSDATIMVWDVMTRRPRREPLSTGIDYLTGTALSPNSQHLALGNSQGTIALWDVTTGEPQGQPLPQNRAGSLAFSPDGHILAIGGYQDVKLNLWDVTTDGPIGEPLAGHLGTVSSLAFSPDGQTLASGGDDWAIFRWNVATGQPLGEPLAGDAGYVYSLAFSPDGQFLASGHDRGTVILWHLTADPPRREVLVGHNTSDSISHVLFSSDSETLASVSTDGTIILWNMAASHAIGRVLTGHASNVRDLSLSPDGRTLASVDTDGTLFLWSTLAGQALSYYDAQASGVTFSPDGQTLAIGKEDVDTTTLWDVTTGRPRGEPLRGRSLIFSPNNKLAATDIQNEIVLWDLSVDPPQETSLNGHSDPVSDLVFSPDGRFLASNGTSNLERMIWDLTTDPPQGALMTGSSSDVSEWAFSPDGETLVIAEGDGILLWDVPSRQVRHELLDKGLDYLALNPDGRTLVGWNIYSDLVSRWNLIVEPPTRTSLIGHIGNPSNITYSPDGWLMAIGDTAGIMVRYGAEDRVLGRLEFGDGQAIRPMLFSRDSKLLVSTRNQEIILWDMDFANWQEQACRQANRNLSQAEWQEFIGTDLPRDLTCPNLPLHPSFVETGRAIAAAGDVAGAVDYFQALLQIDPDLPLEPEAEARQAAVAGLVERGQELAEQGHIDEAVALFEQALTMQPDLDLDPQAEANQLAVQGLTSYGLALARDGDIEKAIGQFEAALALDPSLDLEPETAARYAASKGLSEKAERHYWRGDYDQAIANYTKAIELNPGDAEAYAGRGNAYRNQDKYEQAVTDYSSAIELSPEVDYFYDNRGYVYNYFLGEYEQAIADYTSAIELNPANAFFYNDRGNAYYNQEDYEQAVADYSSAIALRPDVDYFYSNRATVYNYFLGEYEQAIADYSTAIELDPDNVDFYFNRAFVYYGQEEYELAIADYSTAIELDPENASFYSNRGDAYYGQEDYEQAVADYTQAIELNPGDAEAYVRRGNAYRNQDKYEQAVTDYSSAIELSPEVDYFYSNRATVYNYFLGEYEQAIADYTRAIELNPDEGYVYNDRGNAYYNQEDYEQAVADYTQAIELGYEAYCIRREAYLALGDRAAARADAENCNK